MARNKTVQGGGIIFSSIILAVIMMLIPLPDAVRFYRPEFVILVLIYWTMALPHRIGVGYAWGIGLIMDFIMGGTLGVYAFAYALNIYLVHTFHLQLRQHPMWQQAISIATLVLLLQLVLIVGTPRTINEYFWLPVITSMLLWPIFFQLLRFVRRTFHVI